MTMTVSCSLFTILVQRTKVGGKRQVVLLRVAPHSGKAQVDFNAERCQHLRITDTTQLQ